MFCKSFFKSIIFLFLLVLKINCWANDGTTQSINAPEIDQGRIEQLINHVKTSISNAVLGHSKLNNEILTIKGMSSPKVRHFLNNLCSLPETSYLEIGVWAGSTFVSALYGNQQTLKQAVGIDNWSEFNGNMNTFINNTNHFLPEYKQLTGNNILLGKFFAFFEFDCFKFNKAFIPYPINMYFYDGNHSAESHEKAFTHFNDILDKVFIAIIDDWNWGPVKEGTRKAFQALHYKILFEQELPANFNGDVENWWNGLYIAVISKS